MEFTNIPGVPMRVTIPDRVRKELDACRYELTFSAWIHDGVDLDLAKSAKADLVILDGWIVAIHELNPVSEVLVPRWKSNDLHGRAEAAASQEAYSLYEVLSTHAKRDPTDEATKLLVYFPMPCG